MMDYLAIVGALAGPSLIVFAVWAAAVYAHRPARKSRWTSEGRR